MHILTFSADGNLLVAESQGRFTMGDWGRVFEMGLHTAGSETEHRRGSDSDAMVLDDGQGESLRALIRDKIEKDQKWKESVR